MSNSLTSPDTLAAASLHDSGTSWHRYAAQQKLAVRLQEGAWREAVVVGVASEGEPRTSASAAVREGVSATADEASSGAVPGLSLTADAKACVLGRFGVVGCPPSRRDAPAL